MTFETPILTAAVEIMCANTKHQASECSRIIIPLTSFVIFWVAETLWVDLESLWVTLSRFGINGENNESLIDKWNKKDLRSWQHHDNVSSPNSPNND